MENAIWAVFYDLPEEGLDEYLSWFHEVHLPEALSRKGYLWAAHYRILPHEKRVRLRLSDGPALPVDTGYVVLFGGESTRAFLDPTPTQLKERCDPDTREMIGRRIRPVTYIYAVEWRTEGVESDHRDPRGLPAPFIQMGCFDASGQDEELGAWYAQERMVLWSRLPGSVGGRKLVATVGPQRHGVLYDFISMELHQKHFPPINRTEWTLRIHTHLLHAQGSSLLAKRLWPPA